MSLNHLPVQASQIPEQKGLYLYLKSAFVALQMQNSITFHKIGRADGHDGVK